MTIHKKTRVVILITDTKLYLCIRYTLHCRYIASNLTWPPMKSYKETNTIERLKKRENKLHSIFGCI